jgi:hypothetical protein
MMPIKRYLKISIPIATALAALILSLTAISALADGPTIDTQNPSPAISTVFGQTSAAKTGHSLATGDVNGDGFQDLIIAAPYADLAPPHTDCTSQPFNLYVDCVSGGVYLYLGRPGISQTLDLATQPANVTFYAPPNQFSGEQLGRSVAVGDLNGDGRDDIIMGANHYGASPIGAALVWVGRTSITITSAISVNIYATGGAGYNLKLVSAWVADNGGWDVATGNINGDDKDDLIVGMPFASVDPVTDTADPPTDTTSYHPPDYQRYHFSAPGIYRNQNGAAYLWLGRSSFNASSAIYYDVMICLPELTIYGQNNEDHLGRALASGDLDGDGSDDLIIGAEGADGDIGKVYVFFGSALGYANCDPPYDNWVVKDLASITTTADITLTGINPTGRRSGYDVTVGNLNGDAYNDLIIAAPSANSNRGQVYVVYGRARNAFSNTISLAQADVTITGAALDTWLGTAVLAGDLNHDTIDDLLMGAPAAHPLEADDSGTSNSSANGTAYAFFGGSLSSTIDLNTDPPDLTILGAAPDDWLGRGFGIADLNKDTFNELIVGAAGVDYSGRTDTGAAYIINLVYPQQLTLTASLSQVAVGNSVSFTTTAQTWLNPATSNVTTQTTFAISPQAAGSWSANIYTSDHPGTWTVTATFNSRSVTTSLTVIGPPVPGFTCASCIMGEAQSLPFDASSQTFGNQPLTFTWSFGDGASGSGSPLNHAYPDNGSYIARLTVQDTNGLTSTTQRPVTITNLAPTIQSVTNSGPITPGGSVTITVTASDVPSDTLAYAFDCDNNTLFEIGPQPSNQASCQFLIAGAFTVTARASDEDGGSNTGSTTVFVSASAPISSSLFLPIILK